MMMSRTKKSLIAEIETLHKFMAIRNEEIDALKKALVLMTNQLKIVEGDGEE